MLKLTLMVELWALFLPVVCHCSSAQSNCHPYGSSQERPTKILSTSYVVHWCLRAETHPCGKVVSAVVMFYLRLGRSGSLELHQLNSMVIMCALTLVLTSLLQAMIWWSQDFRCNRRRFIPSIRCQEWEWLNQVVDGRYTQGSFWREVLEQLFDFVLNTTL